MKPLRFALWCLLQVPLTCLAVMAAPVVLLLVAVAEETLDAYARFK
jgi:hypothetical protein